MEQLENRLKKAHNTILILPPFKRMEIDMDRVFIYATDENPILPGAEQARETAIDVLFREEEDRIQYYTDRLVELAVQYPLVNEILDKKKTLQNELFFTE